MTMNSEEPVNQEEPRPEGTEVREKGNSLPLILSGIAVLLAALALIANLMGNQTPRVDPLQAVNSKLGQIEARIGDVETQLTSDKLDGVNMQLKRIMLELDQLSSIADDATRSKIRQAYQLLKPLSEPATRVKAEVDVQSTVMPENQTQPEEPAAIPAAVPEDAKTAPEPAASEAAVNTAEPAPAKPATEGASATEPAPPADAGDSGTPRQVTAPSPEAQPDMNPPADQPAALPPAIEPPTRL